MACIFQTGCQTTESAPKAPSTHAADTALLERIHNDEALAVIDTEIKIKFATGTLELTKPGWVTGYGAAGRAGSTHSELKQLYAERLWPLVVNLIAKQKFGDDLHYYLLGYSAEQLGYLEAAAIYYEKSIVESSRPMRGKCLKCFDIEFPDRSIISLERVRLRIKENS